MQPAWNHPAGPKTVFFWAPTIKWALVGAGLADLARPAEKLSVYQVLNSYLIGFFIFKRRIRYTFECLDVLYFNFRILPWLQLVWCGHDIAWLSRPSTTTCLA